MDEKELRAWALLIASQIYDIKRLNEIIEKAKDIEEYISDGKIKSKENKKEEIDLRNVANMGYKT